MCTMLFATMMPSGVRSTRGVSCDRKPDTAMPAAPLSSPVQRTMPVAAVVSADARTSNETDLVAAGWLDGDVSVAFVGEHAPTRSVAKRANLEVMFVIGTAF